MRIAIIGFRFGCNTGKRNTVVWEEYARLYPNDQIHIYTGKKYIWDNWHEELDKQPLPNLFIHQIPIWMSKGGQFKYFFPTIILELFKLKPDTIYAAEEPIHPFVTWMCALYSKIKRKLFFFFTYENQNKIWAFPISLFARICIKNAKGIVCATEKAAKILIKKHNLSGNKISVFPETGIDLKIFKKNVKWRSRKQVILFTGRFIPEKGIKEIINSKKILDEKGKRYEWIFIGSGQMEKYIKNKGGKNIKIFPWTKPEKLPRYYNKAKVFLYPSLQIKKWEEQFGYSMVESLACGTPVVTTPNTGALEILPDKSTLVPFGDSKSLAKKIEAIMRREKEFSYREYVKRKFSITAIAKKWHAIFNKTYKIQ